MSKNMNGYFKNGFIENKGNRVTFAESLTVAILGGKLYVCIGDVFYPITYTEKKGYMVAINERGEQVGKECADCHTFQPREAMEKRRNSIGASCKKCTTARMTDWARKNPERFDENNVRSYRRHYVPKGRRRVDDTIKKAAQMAWNANTTARKFGITDEVTREEMLDVLHLFGFKCALTGTKDDISCEHFIPLSIDPKANVKENIIITNLRVNRSKNDKNILDWFEDKGEYWGIHAESFNRLLSLQATRNSMSVEQYKRMIKAKFKAAAK